MHRSTWLLVLLAGLPAASGPRAGLATVRENGSANVSSITASPARAMANDNRQPAGVLRNGVLTVHLVAQQVTWYPEAEDGPQKIVEAFGEAGNAPRVPGPLLRIPLGTTIDAAITNTLADTLAVLGLRSRSDTIWIAPDSTERVRFMPKSAGSFLYAAGEKLTTGVRFGGTHGQLVGALIVDAARAAPRDRIFVSTGWDPVPVPGNGYFLAMNGKSWPYTERFVHTVGDTVRWRVLNGGASGSDDHPMHLHGFYYRVDARGGWNADTLYNTAQRRWVVTENLPGLSSMSMTWIPERAGNWLFHCHNADHVSGRNRHVVAGRARPYPPIEFHDAREHLKQDMSGIVTAITILPRGRTTVPATSKLAPAPRTLRMLIQARAMYYGPGPGFGYVLQEGAIEPESDSIRIPGPLLVLRQGEPVAITLVNRLPTHTAVHWHGMELDSYYDGVAGWSGAADHTAPMIAPQDSFIARFTPPRAGTFIYHAHITDHVQLARGLYGAMLVMPPNQPYVPESDHVVIVGFGRPNGKASMLVNGSESPLPLPRIRTGTQRLRLINIAPENNAVITLSAASEPISWRAIAKDGFQFPAARRRVQPARVHIFPGETYDFEFESSADVVVVRLKNPTAPASVDDLSLQLRVRR